MLLLIISDSFFSSVSARHSHRHFNLCFSSLSCLGLFFSLALCVGDTFIFTVFTFDFSSPQKFTASYFILRSGKGKESMPAADSGNILSSVFEPLCFFIISGFWSDGLMPVAAWNIHFFSRYFYTQGLLHTYIKKFSERLYSMCL